LLPILADAWTPMLLAGTVVAVRQIAVQSVGLDRLVLIALVGGAVATASKLFLVDPFYDVECWRSCEHNTLALTDGHGAGRALESIGIVLIAVAAGWCGWLLLSDLRRRTARSVGLAVSGLVVVATSVGSGLLALVVDEGTASAFWASLALVQLAVITMAVVAAIERVQAMLLGARLTRLASSLPTSPPPGALADALRDAVGDPSVKLHYWAPARDCYVDSQGSAQFPVEPSADSRLTLVARGGTRIAAISHAASIRTDRLDRALGPAMRLALQNDQLRAATLAELRELQLSRTRILERASLERRRLERNLHDGAQQRVVSLALFLRMLQSAVHTPQAAELAARAADLTEVILGRLRELARGIHPAVLDDSGLHGALVDLAEASTDLAVEVNGSPLRRCRTVTETVAYRVVEAVIADARRRHAALLSISAVDRDGRLVLDVRDDGGPSPVSMAALVPQINALGGVLTLDSGGGEARLRLELPCES
jgi:signal transduction histidine kinase